MDVKNMEWQAQWIYAEGEESPRNEWRCFRKSFVMDSESWEAAELSITADSRYVVYVNGVQVGRGPVRSWPFEQFYDTYEVGHLLVPGQSNTIAVLVMHYGISTFSYLRGRGGLLVQLELIGDGEARRTAAATDETWLTALHDGYDRHTQRMSCQLAFAEKVDARLWPQDWMETNFSDAGWSAASVLGPVGMAPWTKLVPRDIPHLTEEPMSPARVLTLREVKPVSWAAAIDLRYAMDPSSAAHANPTAWVGAIGTVIRTERPAKAVLGFTYGMLGRNVCVLNGRKYQGDDFYGVSPEKYVEVELKAGDNLLLVDVTGGDHGSGYRMAIDSEAPFEVVSPYASGSADSVLFQAGPFDVRTWIDFIETPGMTYDHEVLQACLTASEVGELEPHRAWIRPMPDAVVSEEDVFALSVWKRSSASHSIPSSLQNAVIPNAASAVIPRYEGADTELVIDFGKELSGYIQLDVDAPAGTIVDMYGFEYMRDDYRQETYALDNTLRYVCKQGRQTYASPVRRGLRYLMVTVRYPGASSKPVKLYHVGMIQSNYPVADIGKFQCSDPLLNDIWQISGHTTRLCMEDTFVDCPAYEQTFWVGDSRNEAIVNYYVFGDHEIVKRCLRLVPGSRVQTPLYSDQVPSGWSSVIPNWTFFWAIACYEYSMHTGDKAFAAEIWPQVRFTLDHYLEKIDQRGLLHMRGWNFFDWAPIDQPHHGVVTHQNLFLVKTLRSAAELASFAGSAEEGTRYVAAAERLSEAINAHLWSEEKMAFVDCIHADGRYSDVFSMQTQVVALLCDIAQGDRKTAIERYMKAPPAAFVQIGSPFMSFFYYEALTKLGKTGFMLDDIRRHYGQMLRYDATTCWEMYPNFAENRANPAMLSRSHCHAWSAAPGYFLGANVLGVRSAAPGWAKVIVAPEPCDLRYARGTVPLPEGGTIDVDWEVDGAGVMKLQVWAPRGLDLDIRLPEGFEGSIERFEV